MQKDISRRGFLGTLALAGAGLFVPEALSNVIVSDSYITLPGINRQVGLKEKILSRGHFTWGEATKNGTRIPNTEDITEGIFEIAKYMEDVREYFGNRPIIVKSWYRDPVSNKQVGGRPHSKPLQGIAVDFKVQGINPYEVYEKMDGIWKSKGGLGKYHAFTHIDCRGERARWNGS